MKSRFKLDLFLEPFGTWMKQTQKGKTPRSKRYEVYLKIQGSTSKRIQDHFFQKHPFFSGSCCCSPPNKKLTWQWKNPPWMKMYFLLKHGNFPVSHVSWLECFNLLNINMAMPIKKGGKGSLETFFLLSGFDVVFLFQVLAVVGDD